MQATAQIHPGWACARSGLASFPPLGLGAGLGGAGARLRGDSGLQLLDAGAHGRLQGPHVALPGEEVEAARGAVEPVTSYFGMTRRWPGLSAVPFGMLLASAIAEAGTP